MSKNTTKATSLGGRPKKADHERRVRQPKIRLTIAEENHLRKRASDAGMTFAEYVRERALGPSPGPATSSTLAADGEPGEKLLLARLLRELNAVGVNLNQLTRDYHSGRDGATDWQHVQDELSRVLAQVGDHFS